jgi:hypothetical protein
MNQLRNLALALLLPVLLPVSAAAASPRETWEYAPLSWVRRKPAERDAPPNGQPLRVDPATLVQVLGQVTVRVRAKDEPLFSEEEAAALGKTLAEALALAGPGEDLEVLSTYKRTKFILGAPLGVTARVFAQDGKLNLIVRDARLDWVYGYYNNYQMPPITYGSRAKAGSEVLQAPGAESRRPDWLVLPLDPVAPVVAPVPVAAPPVPAAEPAPAAKPMPSASVEERLQGLKRFREQNLITEEEYRQKKQDLLKEY